MTTPACRYRPPAAGRVYQKAERVMDTGKVYQDSDGNDCSIFSMVRREPYWAAVRVQEGEKAIAKVDRLEKINAELLEALEDAAALLKPFSGFVIRAVGIHGSYLDEKCDKISAAIANAKGQQ